MPPFFFKETATTEIYPLSLHDALPIGGGGAGRRDGRGRRRCRAWSGRSARGEHRSEEHTSELQYRLHFECRLFFLKRRPPRRSTLFPYTTLFRSVVVELSAGTVEDAAAVVRGLGEVREVSTDRKSTRLNSSTGYTSNAAFFF